MEFFGPVEGVGHEEIADLVAAEVKDIGAPIGLLAAAGIGVLVESLAVKATKGPIILGEVCRHPVHDDADAVFVQGIDQLSEFIRRAPTRRRRVVARDLVAPGSAEGMLGHGQELDVGETVLLEVRDELLAQAVVVGTNLPRANVHLIDAHGHIELAGALVHPGGIGPGEAGGIHDRVRLRRAGGALS